MKLLIVAIIMIYNHVSWAGGNELGNGGQSIVCKSGEVIFYDYYEGRHRFIPFVYKKFNVSENHLGYFPISDVISILNRLDKFDQEFSDKLKKYANEFAQESVFESGDADNVDDCELRVIPAGCVVKTMVVQTTRTSNDEIKYHINFDLWQQLDTKSKVFTIIHEIVYRVAIEKDPSLFNASNIQYFGEYLISDQFLSVDSKKYFALKTNLGL